MAVDHYVLFRVEFLVRAVWDFAHWDQGCAFYAGGFMLPGLTNVDELERIFAVDQVLYFFRGDFVIQSFVLKFRLRPANLCRPFGAEAGRRAAATCNLLSTQNLLVLRRRVVSLLAL